MKFIERISDQTNIVYYTTPELGGGLIAPRESVILRQCQDRNNVSMCVGTPIEHPSRPPNPDYVR